MTLDAATITALSQLMLSVATLLGVIASLLVSLRNGRATARVDAKADQTHAAVAEVKTDVAAVKELTNGKAEMLLQTVKEASFAAGQRDEHQHPT